MRAGIPEMIHICPGCEDLATGDLYCESCARMHRSLMSLEQEAERHAERAHALFDGLRRERVPMRRGGRWASTAARRVFQYGVGLGVCVFSACFLVAALLGVRDVLRAVLRMR